MQQTLNIFRVLWHAIPAYGRLIGRIARNGFSLPPPAKRREPYRLVP